MLRGGCRYEGRSVSGGPWVGRPGQLQLVEEMPTGSLTVGRWHPSQSPCTACSGAAKNVPAVSTSRSSPDNVLPTVLAAGGRWSETAWPRAGGVGWEGPRGPCSPSRDSNTHSPQTVPEHNAGHSGA